MTIVHGDPLLVLELQSACSILRQGMVNSPNPKGFHIATMHQKSPPKTFYPRLTSFYVRLFTLFSFSLTLTLKYTSQFSLCSTITENQTRIAKNNNGHLVLFSHFIGKKMRRKQVNFPEIMQLVEGRGGESPRNGVPSHRPPAMLAALQQLSWGSSLIFSFSLLGAFTSSLWLPYDTELTMTHTHNMFMQGQSQMP